MTDYRDNPGEYEYLKGITPTENQIRHLRDDLFYEGPAPNDAYETSNLISALHSNHAVQSRRMYEYRMKDGPSWLVWEKWMILSRKEYDKDHWQSWWTETRRLGFEAGIIPAQMPPLPSKWNESPYSTAQELMNEVRELLGAPNGEAVQMEMSVASMEEAINEKEKIANMREYLRTIDEDASWTIARLREATHGDPLIGELFEANVGGKWRGVLLHRDQSREMKKSLIKSYTCVRGVTKSLNAQMRDFLKRINSTYRK